MFSISKKFSSKLSLTVLLLAAPIFFASLGILFTQSRRMIQKEAEGRVSNVLNYTIQRIGQFISSVETATNSNSKFITEQLEPDSLLALTRFIVTMNGSIEGCSISMEPYVFPSHGRHFSVYSLRERLTPSATLPPDTIIQDSIISIVEQEYDYFNKDWYSIPRTRNAPCWVDFYLEVDTLELAPPGMFASYSLPIHDDNGRLLGIISSDLSLDMLNNIILQDAPFPNSYYMMINSKGHYIIHPDSTRLFSQSIFDEATADQQPALIALGHEMTKGKTGRMSLIVDGVSSIVAYQAIPGTSWSLAMVCPESDILTAYHKQTHILVPLIIIGLVFILLLCHNAVTHAIRPLNDLLVKTQSIASGNMEVYIPQSQRIDAIGKLQNSFASMLQRLNFHIGSVQYITEQARLRNEELAKTTQLAEEADRQKTTFIQNVTHQIRTPLNIIMGFTQILNVTENLTEKEQKSIITTISHNSNLLYRMVIMLYDSSDLGFFEELNCNKKNKVACNKLVRDTINYIMLNFPDVHINFQTEVSDDFAIHTNLVFLTRSLRELIYNSAKYSDGQHVTIYLTAKEGKVYFTVEDTGKGIKETDLDSMFSFFTKQDDLSEGLGLGLPLAKRHILNLGGELTIDTNYHEGCRFTISLPIEPQSHGSKT